MITYFNFFHFALITSVHVSTQLYICCFPNFSFHFVLIINFLKKFLTQPLPKMSSTPLLNELKQLCGSEKIHDCFIFLNIQEVATNELSMINAAAMRDDLRMQVDQRTERLIEVNTLHSDVDQEMATQDVFDALHEVQLIERRLVESLAGVVADFQRLIALKKETIETLEKYEEE